MKDVNKIRNIAIIAHVDHGKTTLVDKLLEQSGTLAGHSKIQERVMDSNELEQERGITILSKNTAIEWQEYRINIVDTPGHADFGGEVERILSMVDSVLLLVDAVDGPMPQTRFVTQKAFAKGLKPIIIVNKIDRPSARPDWVIDQVFDLFDNLGASDEQLDFPIIYASALQGFAKYEMAGDSNNMEPLFQTIIDKVAPPQATTTGNLQLQISSLDYSNFVGIIGIGRISKGILNKNQEVVIINRDGEQRRGKIAQVYGYLGLKRIEIDTAQAGDIIAISGIPELTISETICDKNHPVMLPPLFVDEPTITMTFQVNDSPFAGKDGKYVTSRKIRERLYQEASHNIALRVEDTIDPDKFKVSGRGELHLGILIETMRREGYELAVSRPEVIIKEENGRKLEPYEQLTVEVPENAQGAVMEALGLRKGQLKDMLPDSKGRVRLDYIIPARGVIGFHNDFLTITSGRGILSHVFCHYDELEKNIKNTRKNGGLIASVQGVATGYSLWNLQARGKLIIGPQVEVYEGMIIGLHTRANDLIVNVTKGKQLTNVRASGTDDNIVLSTPIKLTLEYALEFINDDELVEVTPNFIRIRKKYLKEHERKKFAKSMS